MTGAWTLRCSSSHLPPLQSGWPYLPACAPHLSASPCTLLGFSEGRPGPAGVWGGLPGFTGGVRKHLEYDQPSPAGGGSQRGSPQGLSSVPWLTHKLAACTEEEGWKEAGVSRREGSRVNKQQGFLTRLLLSNNYTSNSLHPRQNTESLHRGLSGVQSCTLCRRLSIISGAHGPRTEYGAGASHCLEPVHGPSQRPPPPPARRGLALL